VLEIDAPRFYAVADLGVRTRPAASLPGVLPVRTGHALGVALAAGFYADQGRSFAAGSELVAESTFAGGADLLDPRASAAHWLITGRYRVDGGPFEVGAALGPGFGAGPGAADWRASFSLGYAPERAAPPRDDDDDGVPDKVDACLELRGVPSADPLLHGCPDVADRDGDAIPDENDACPTQAGEATFVRRTHGCPKPVDSDGDGVPDRTDACPREPGVPPPDGNGCPAPPPPPPDTARLEGARIVIAERVQFETGTAALLAESDAILSAVARVLRDNPQVARVEVQGHTDGTGPEALNVNLGQQRAEAVVKWLVDHGIAAPRLVARGYGATRPIADNATEGGRTRNRRVDFVVDAPAPAPAPEEPKHR
jgi:outer membrane protein OmpA-like peptidoglycan-associated protein